MMMGDLLRRLARAPDDSLVLELVPDIVLLARARQAAAAGGRSLGAYVLAACRRYMDAASEEEWTALVGRFQDGAEPGPSFVEAALRRSLDAAPGCGCGTGQGGRLREPAGSI